MATIAELLTAAVPSAVDTTTGATIADLLGGAPDTQEVTQGREQSQTNAVAESLGVTPGKVKSWTKGAVIDGRNIEQLREEKIAMYVPESSPHAENVNKLLKSTPGALQDPALVRKAEVLREMNRRIALNKRVEQNLPETLSFAGLDTKISLKGHKSVAAALVGAGDMMLDSIHGIQQAIGKNEAELAADQASVRELYQSVHGEAATIGAIGGAIAEPLGIVLPVAKTTKLWQTALASASVGGTFGATGYVDKEAGQTRLGNTVLGTTSGLMLSPVAYGLGKAAHAAGEASMAKAGATVVDNFEKQTQKYQAAGASTQLALRAAKRKFGYTDETLAAAVQASKKKPHIMSRPRAKRDIQKIEDFEAAMTVAPTSRLGKAVEDLITPISTRLQRISRPVFHRMKKHDLQVQTRETHYFGKVDPFLKGLAKMDDDSALTINKALMTGDFQSVRKILHETGDKKLLANFGQVQAVLKDIYKNLRKVGYDLPKIDNYFPRIVKDIEAVSRLQHDQVSNALRKALKTKGGELTTHEISNALDSLIVKTHNRTFAHTSGSLKKRTKHVIDDKLLPHYERPEKALHSYIRSTVADIERRKLFNHFGHKKKLSRVGGDLDDSIGSLLADARTKGLSKADQNEVADLLRARFGPGEKASSQGIQLGKNLIYTATLGNPISAATQFGDVVFSAQRHGIARTVQAMFGKKLVKKELLGLTDAIEEFVSTNGSKKILDWSLKWGGFKTVDRLGKETLLNASLNKYNSWSKSAKGQKKFTDQWGKYFGNETKQLMDDVANKKLTENVKLMLWHELSGVQPISLSEMPKKYLQHPDGRVLYMLRTFTIKQLDFMRREILNQARKNPGKAAVLMAKFAGLFVLGNSTVDAMKDVMQGKEINMEDHFVDNVWTLLGVNKYTVDSVTRQGPGRAAIDFIAPPLTVFDDLYRGIDDPKRIWNLIPPYGKLIKAWSETDRDAYMTSLDLGKFEPTEIEDLLK